MSKIKFIFREFWLSYLLSLSNAYTFCQWRVKYYRKLGYAIGQNTSISPNVRIIGKFAMGDRSSLAQNVSVSGGQEGVIIGKNVMVAPNCVIVAFNHGISDTNTPMIDQPCIERPIVIEDDVWIGANCTICAGVTIGTGSVITANSAVIRDVPPFSLAGGVPAKVIKSRLSTSNSI